MTGIYHEVCDGTESRRRSGLRGAVPLMRYLLDLNVVGDATLKLAHRGTPPKAGNIGLSVVLAHLR